MAKPLQGVRVLDLSHVLAGALASFYLAQLGADAIKVEPPHGAEVMRSQPGFVALNAGKRSLAVDIHDAASWMSTASERLPAFSATNPGWLRITSAPCGGSTLMASAPSCAR